MSVRAFYYVELKATEVVNFSMFCVHFGQEDVDKIGTKCGWKGMGSFLGDSFAICWNFLKQGVTSVVEDLF